MSHSSPASYLVWTLFTSVLGLFLIFHLWSFDRFKCLRWDSGAHSGAFKRIMTYSYLVTVPLILTYAAGNMAIKYSEGFVEYPLIGIIPKPYQFWGPMARRTIFPLMLLFTLGWSLEMVTHLEELCFWLFLVNSGSSQRNWFESPYFKIWVAGSAIAMIYMPLVTILTRADPLKSEAFTFLAGSLGSLSLTLWFTPILWTFPSFLNNLRAEGVDMATIVRLTKFAELNTIRIVFRFLFTVPFLILGVDGVRPHHHINESMLWVDFLTMLAGFGCAASSGITLVIFFPRSVEGEIAARDAAKERKRSRSFGTTASFGIESDHREMSGYPPPSTQGGTYLLTSSPIKNNFSLEDVSSATHHEVRPARNTWDEEERDVPADLPPPMRPNRKRRDVEADGQTDSSASSHNLRTSGVNPMVSNFTSPIDFVYTPGDAGSSGSRLTFNRR